jgi:hypothetical protein
MRVAFHFDSGRYGSFYGPPITRLLFEGVLHCVPCDRRDVFIRRGDMPFWDLGAPAADMSILAARMFEGSREIWSTLTEDALANALHRVPIWVLAVEGVSPTDAICVDSRLRRSDGYLGAIEIYLANPTHWVFYDRKLVAAYRLYENDLRILEISEQLDPEARDESRIKQWSDTGLFSHVVWEDVGFRDTVFDDLSDFDRAKRVALIEDRLGSSLGPVVSILLMRIAGLNPKLSDSLHAAVETLDRAGSEEQLAQASLSCRRFIGQLADALYPPREKAVNGRKVGPQEYRNRLWAYVEKHAGRERSQIHGTFQELGERLDMLDERAQKHVHGLRIERADVLRLILMMIVWSYDVLTLTHSPTKARTAPHWDTVRRFAEKIVARSKKGIH